MRWLGLLIMVGFFSVATGGAFLASADGWGLPGLLEKPVSIRQESVRSGRTGRRSGMMFMYFGSRRHTGGGFRGGK